MYALGLIRRVYPQTSALPPLRQPRLEELSIGSGWRDQLHRHSQLLDLKVAVLVVEEELRGCEL